MSEKKYLVQGVFDEWDFVNLASNLCDDDHSPIQETIEKYKCFGLNAKELTDRTECGYVVRPILFTSEEHFIIAKALGIYCAVKQLTPTNPSNIPMLDKISDIINKITESVPDSPIT